MKRLGAIILCGGRSRRMGRPKEWLSIGGEALLQRVVRLVSTRADLIIVSAAEGQSLPDLPRSVEVVRDPAPDLGPLQGLSTGLDALDSRADWAFATAADAPLLRPKWIDRLLGFTGGVDLVLPLV